MDIGNTLPAAVKAWIAAQHQDITQVKTVGVKPELRPLTQEETNYSHYRDYTGTGLYDVALEFTDGTLLFSVFTEDEMKS